MTTLNEYLVQKKAAVEARAAQAEHNTEVIVHRAKVRAAGRSGVREIRIRDFQIISDSPDDFAGYNLGPSSPELQLGVLGSCLTHITLIQASIRGVSLETLEVEVTGELHPLAGKPGYEEIPVYPHNIAYTVTLGSTETDETIQALREAVERVCPIYNLLVNPQTIQGQFVKKS
ncbi:OsmC family protein [Paenibacillus sp. FSL H7-0331]|uniref:OsmC family protein n=1 Tax=Paenibacillus sp. FSL H7-0331 TaxID=1920421 RepID=UPI00096D85A7|nr:OsmC family protein [Paenibacillus sp. FSL H7-0331]OMF12779.1 osmotically inducible protein OsmC [Paenibacillus sp. FSL H7-0331]